MTEQKHRDDLNKAVALRMLSAGIPTFSIHNKRPITPLWPKLRNNLTAEDFARYKQSCKEDGKTPQLTLGSASTKSEVQANFRLKPGCGVGVNLGVSALAVLDLDVRKNSDGSIKVNGVEWFKELCEANGYDITQHPVVDTPSGGMHVYGSDPEGLPTRHMSELGVDFKATGGYVVAAGSIREDGGVYRPRPGHPDLVELHTAADVPRFPKWLLDLIRANRGKAATLGDDDLADKALELRCAAPQPLASDFDLDRLAEASPTLKRALSGQMKSTSDVRFAIAIECRSAFGDKLFTPEQFRAACMSTPLAGSYVTGAAKTAEFNDRNLTRDYWNAVPVIGTPTDGEAFGSVDGPADPKDPDGPLPASQQAKKDAQASAKTRGIILPTKRIWRAFKDIPATRWIVYPMFARGVVGALVGPGGVAKSRLVAAELLAVVTGRPEIAGWPADTIIERCSVWYHCQEDDLDEIDKRITALGHHHGVDQVDYDGSFGFELHVTSGLEKPLTLAWRDNETRQPIVNPNLPQIEQFIAQNKIGLYVVDPIIELHELEENSSVDMRVVWGAARQIAHKTGCHVCVIAHSKKPDSATNKGHAGDMNTLRGSGAATGVIRMARTVFGMSEEDAKALDVDPDRRGKYLRVDDAKNNLAPLRSEPEWLERVSVEQDNDRRNDVGILTRASFVARPVRRRMRITANALAEAARLVLRETLGPGEHAVQVVVEASTLLCEKYPEAAQASRSFKRDVLNGETRFAMNDGWLVYTTIKGAKGSTVRFEPGNPAAAADPSDGFGAVEDP